MVADGSPLVGRTLARAGLAEPTGGRLLDITRAGETIADPPADWTLAAGDALAFDATIATVGQLWTTLGLAAANPPRVDGDEYATRLVEGVVAVDSPYIGGPASELARAGRKVVAVSRGSARARLAARPGARRGGRQRRAPDGLRGRRTSARTASR